MSVSGEILDQGNQANRVAKALWFLFSFFIVSLMLPLSLYVDYWSSIDPSVQLKTRLFRGLVFAALAAVTLWLIFYKKAYTALPTNRKSLFVAFALFLVVNSTFSIDVFGSYFSSFAFLFLLLFLSFFSNLIVRLQKEDLLAWTSGFIIFVAFFLILYLGFDLRRVGGIPANVFGKIIVTAVFFALLFNNKIYTFVFISVSIVISFYLQSRGTILAIVMMVFLSVFFQILARRTVNLYSGLLVSVVFFLGVCIAFVPDVSEKISVFISPEDAERSVEGSFGSRIEYTLNALSNFQERPLMGLGFQTRADIESAGLFAAAHNGYANLLLDVGIIAWLVLLIICWYTLYRALFLLLKAPGKINIGALSACFSFMFVYMFLALFEPVYINIGTPISWAFIFAVFYILSQSRVAERGRIRSLKAAY